MKIKRTIILYCNFYSLASTDDNLLEENIHLYKLRIYIARDICGRCASGTAVNVSQKREVGQSKQIRLTISGSVRQVHEIVFGEINEHFSLKNG